MIHPPGDTSATAATPRPRRGVVALQVGQFALIGALAVGIVGLGTAIASRRVGEREAITEARTATLAKVQGSVEPLITDAVVNSDPAALAALGAAVHRDVLDDRLVRVKLWRDDGTILYSDEPRLVGSQFALGDDELTALHQGAIQADVSDLAAPENQYERQYGKLLEVYLPVQTPTGRRVLFESYYQYSLVDDNGQRLWRSFAPVALGALVLLELVQIPIFWSLARRLRQRGLEREALLLQTLEASDVERRQIASDLHDGAVQELAGVAYALSALARREPDGNGTSTQHVVEESAASVRHSIRALRSLIVDIYPPDFHEVDFDSALTELLARASDQGLTVALDTEGLRRPLPDASARLLYRAAQEGVRNALQHADASAVSITVAASDGRGTLDVTDDGRGFDEDEVIRRRAEGHVGLTALRGLVADAGGTLDIRTPTDRGSTLHVEVPLP